MIEGVKAEGLRVIQDERGYLMEMFRSDSQDFEKFGQVYVTVAYPGVVKAWHCHKKQTDNFVCVAGTAKVGLYDAREGSPTKGETATFILGCECQRRVTIPPGVYHGFTAVGTEPVSIVNIPTELYDHEHPDEYRRPWDDPEIGYDWSAANE